MDLYPPDEETPEASSALLKREIKLWGDLIRANDVLPATQLTTSYSGEVAATARGCPPHTAPHGSPEGSKSRATSLAAISD